MCVPSVFLKLLTLDVERVSELVRNCTVIRFDCGHGIHTEKPKEFVQCVMAQKKLRGPAITLDAYVSPDEERFSR